MTLGPMPEAEPPKNPDAEAMTGAVRNLRRPGANRRDEANGGRIIQKFEGIERWLSVFGTVI